MTDAELISTLDGWINQGIVCLLSSDIAPIRDHVANTIYRLKNAKSSMIDVLFSVDEEDDERLAWAIQCVRDDLGDVNE
jgi:hypothetical protein